MLSHAQVLINENFSTASGATPPAGWVSTDVTSVGMIWRFNNPGSRTITGGTPGFSGNFAILDSDNGSFTNENATLESPAFDASLPATYRLEYDNQYRNVGSAPEGVPTVEVWNGTAWTAVLTYPTTSADGYPNPASHKSIDITTGTGGSAAAKVRFHWVTGSDDWWWAIDNVTVTRINCTAPTATYTIVPNCSSNQFSVNVTITNMGSATSLPIKEGTTVFATATVAGTYSIGPFASGTSHTLTLEHNDPVCIVVSPTQTYTCPPPNDDAANAVTLTVNPNYLCGSSANGSTIAASQSTDPAPGSGCSPTGINDDVWFKFVAGNTSHRIVFNNVTTGTMVAALYTGTPGSLTPVSGACGSTTLNATGLVPGTTYYIRAYTSTATATTTTTFTICVGTLPPPPINDECANAINVPISPNPTCAATVSGTLQSATASTGPTSNCGTYDDDVWYSFVATGSSHIVTLMNITGSVTDLTFQVLNTCGATSTIVCSDPNSALLTGLTPGSTYYIRVASYTSTGGQNTIFDVCVATPYPPPANDECANAINVPVNPTPTCAAVVSGTVAGATASAGPSASCGTFDDDVWYSFTATAAAHTITLQNIGGSTSDLSFQVLNNCGAAAGITCSDPESAIVSGLTPGNTYYLRVASYTSIILQTSTFDVCITTQPMVYTSCTTAQPSTSGTAAGGVNQQIIQVAVVVNGIGNPFSVTQLDFNTTGTTNTADIMNARVYYTGTSNTFSTATPFGTVTANPSGSFSVTGNQVLTGNPSGAANNYFWLAYDLACAATPANVLDAQCTSVTVAGTPQTPTVTNPSGTRAITTQIGTFQPSTAVATAGTLNNQVLRVDVQPCGASSVVESLTFATTGSTAPATDISNAKVYYTTSTSFSSATQYGTTVVNPNGSFTVSGSQSITATGYFWLTYDLNCSAPASNLIDASCSSVTLSGTPFAVTTPNPTGTRTIASPSYTAATNQPSTATATAGSVNNPVLRVDLTGCINALVTSITFGTASSTSAANMLNAKVYYTTSTTFSTAVLFGTFSNPSGAFTITGNQTLGTGTGYFWLTYDLAPAATAGNVIDASCASATINGNTATPATANPTGTRSIVTPTLANDNATGAVVLGVGAGCAGALYNNVTSSMSAGEPYPSCSGSSWGTVWFSFVAPTGGAVRVSTDVGSGATFTDHKVALFSAGNVNDYSTFNIIACDDDNGSASSSASVLYATGLTAGNTYYVGVDRFGSTTTTGTFCIAVDSLNTTMLATANSCASSYQAPVGTTNFTGWIPLVDGSSRLVALVRNTAGTTAGAFTCAQNVNTGGIRQDAAGAKYLDRNFRITNATAGTYDVQLFMLNTEQATLQAADPNATLANLKVTRQTGESSCTNNFATGGTNSLITQSGSGSANGVSWIQFSTPGFSNFFINAGTTPLPVVLESFDGINKGAVNYLNWETAEEQRFSHFELQRSANGIDFSKVATINANRKPTGSTYAYVDERPYEGINIYRLNMVDMDGKITVSGIVKLIVKSGNGLAVSVHPNPVNQQLNVALTGKADGIGQIQVLDIMGKMLHQTQMDGNSTIIDMSPYAKGSYMILYKDKSHHSVTKVIKN